MNVELFDNCGTSTLEQIQKILTGAKLQELDAIYVGDEPEALCMKVTTAAGEEKLVQLGSDNDGFTDLPLERLELNNFYMMVAEEGPLDLKDLQMCELEAMREFAYKSGADLAADEAMTMELAISLYLMSERLRRLKNTFILAGHEIHEEIARRERED